MQGGGVFETGAGGSGPKNTLQQLRERKNHLRMDRLGEFCRLGESLKLPRAHPEGTTVQSGQLLGKRGRRATKAFWTKQ